MRTTRKQYIHPIAFMPIAPGSKVLAANGLNIKNIDPTQTDLSGLASGALGIGTTLAESGFGIGEVSNTTERNFGSMGGALSGAGSGASMGASIGLNPALLAATGGLSALAVPVGAIIGGIAGQKSKEKELNEYAASKESLYRAYGGSIKKYELGGEIDMIQGPNHEQGGVELTPEVEAEGGEALIGSEVLSDRLINPETGNTFAKDAEKLKQKYAERDFDPITSRTQAKQIARLVELNNAERKKQEELEQGIQEDFMAYGGHIKDGIISDTLMPFIEDSAKMRGLALEEYKEKLLACGGNKKMVLGGNIEDPVSKLLIKPLIDPLTGMGYVQPNIFPNDPTSKEFNAFFKNKSGQELKFYQDLYANQNTQNAKNYLTSLATNLGSVAATPSIPTEVLNPELETISNEVDYGEGNLWENSEEGQYAIRRMQGFEDEKIANSSIDDDIISGRFGYDKKVADYLPTNDGKATTDEVNTNAEKLALLMSNLPALDNLAKSINPEKTRLETLKPELINLEAAREANKRSAAMAQANMRESLRGTGNTSSANLAALTAGTTGLTSATQEANLNSFIQEQTTNAQIKNNVNAANVQIKNNEKDINAMNKAMGQSLRNLALADISTNTQAYMKDVKLSKTQELRNKEILGIINSIDPNYKVIKENGTHKIVYTQGTEQKTIELK